MSTLSENPVLFLAIDNLSKMSSIDEKQLSTIWNLFTKCKDNLENGRRLENISWRLWYRSTHFPVPALEKNSSPMSTSFSKVLATPMYEKKPMDNLNSNPEASFPITLNIPCTALQSTNEASLLISDNTEIESLKNHCHLDHTVIDHSLMDLNLDDINQQVLRQERVMDQDSTRDKASFVNSGIIKAKFFLSDSSEQDFSVESIEMKRDISEDDDTDYSEDDDDGFSYSTDWSWTPSPLFSKIPLSQEFIAKKENSQALRKKSQLSVALNCNSRQEVPSESVNNNLSSSMRQTLLWDRCMPFNTKYSKDRTVNEDWRNEDSAEYW